MLSTGQLLADRYRLSRRIAVGGMGEVWAAQDSRLDRDVAIKVLKAELSGDPEFLHRFRTEARTTASLNHPGVAAVHDYGETASVPDGPEDTAYLVMELVDGEPLAALISKHGRMSVEFTLDVLEQSARALQAAHESGLVHRDVKPGNIMVASKPGGELAVKLTDFGIAKAAHAAPVTRSGMVMGTAHYIAPEQATGSEAGPASDVYSLAVCGYECLAGRRPFLSDHAVTVAMQHIRDMPPPLPGDIPPSVRALIEIAMVKDPRQRYGSGGEFANAVGAVRAGHPAPAPAGFNGAPTQVMGGQPSTQLLPAGPPSGPHTGPYQQPPPFPQRKPSKAWLWVLLGLVLVAALVLVGFALTNGRDDHAPGVPASSGSTSTTTPDRTTPGDTARQPERTTEKTQDETTEDTTSGAVSGPTVNTVDYLGKPASAVARELENKGLRAKVVGLSGAKPKNPDRCLVMDLSRQGQLPEGTRVIVTCAQTPG